MTNLMIWEHDVPGPPPKGASGIPLKGTRIDGRNESPAEGDVIYDFAMRGKGLYLRGWIHVGEVEPTPDGGLRVLADQRMTMDNFRYDLLPEDCCLEWLDAAGDAHVITRLSSGQFDRESLPGPGALVPISDESASCLEDVF